MLAATAVSYATESLTDALWAELAPLLQQHADEIAHFRDLPLAPDFATYARIQANGGLRCYTARLNGQLIGYLAIFVSRSLHYSASIFANSDVLYIDPAHRGSRAGVGLITYCHDQLRAEGVTVLTQHVKARKDINVGPMLERLLGYEKVDELYAIRLDRES